VKDLSFYTNKKRYFFISALLIVCFFFTFAKISTPFFDVYYYYFIVIALFPILFIKYKLLPKGILVFFSFFLIIGLYHVSKGNNTLDQLTKVWGSTFVMYLFYFFIIKYFKYDLSRIFGVYVQGAFWVSCLGILQIIAHIYGVRWAYDYSWIGLDGVRSYYGIKDGIAGLYPIHSIYGEPAHFGCGIAPAAFVALYNLFSNNRIFINRLQSLIILVAMIFTTATSAYFALFCSIIIIIFNSSSFITFLITLCTTPILFYYLYNFNSKFQNRIDGVLDLFQDESSLSVAIMATSGSVRILFNNTYIAFKNASEHFLFGSGLGSHATAYFKYSLIPYWHEDYGLNYNDANSLFNRLLSETGVIGLLILFIFLFKYSISKKQNIELWLINKGSLIIVLTYLVRQGHYFTYAFPLFVLFYYYSNKISKLPQHNY